MSSLETTPAVESESLAPTAVAVEPQSQSRPKSMLREYFQYAAETFVMFLFFMTFTAQAVEVPTGSMQNTILIGDHLLVNKFIFAPGAHLPFLPQREIRRGDIIVFKYPGNKYEPNQEPPGVKPFSTYYVKRVIGLPGDYIEVRGTSVFINGQALQEHVIQAVDHNDKAPLEMAPGQDTAKADAPYNVYYEPTARGADADQDFPAFTHDGNGRGVTVPSDSYFVMGDNRDNSADSRYWGFVSRDLVVGRPMFVLWSYDASAPASTNPVANFFEKMRWSRIGTMVK